jgi:hypothetical protein
MSFAPPPLGRDSSGGSFASHGSNFSSAFLALANDPIGALVPVMPRMVRVVRGALSAAGRAFIPTHQVTYDPTLDSFYAWVGQPDGMHRVTITNFTPQTTRVSLLRPLARVVHWGRVRIAHPPMVGR